VVPLVGYVNFESCFALLGGETVAIQIGGGLLHFDSGHDLVLYGCLFEGGPYAYIYIYVHTYIHTHMDT
jgi:hypothetical protein